MKVPVSVKVDRVAWVQSYPINFETVKLGNCSGRSLLIEISGRGIYAELLIPIWGRQPNAFSVLIEADPNIEGFVWVRLVSEGGEPIGVKIAPNFVWDDGLPFSLN